MKLFKSRKKESARLYGEFWIHLYGPDGKLKDYRHVKNLTTLVGFTAVTKQMCDTAAQPDAFHHVAIGYGVVAAADTDTALGNELARVTGVFTSVSAKVCTVVGTFAAGVGTGAVTESGLLSLAAVGILLCRQVFAVVNKGADDSMVVTWQYTLS
jgi:hypothetical protein